MTIVDTDILIDVARGTSGAVDFIDGLDSPAISVVTQMELIIGCRNKTELHNLAKFVERFEIIRITSAISDPSVELLSQYHLSHGLLIADSFIAATAIVNSRPLAKKISAIFASSLTWN